MLKMNKISIFSLDNTSDLILSILVAFSEQKIIFYLALIFDFQITRLKFFVFFFFLYKIWKIFIFTCFIYQQEISMYLTDYTWAIFFRAFYLVLDPSSSTWILRYILLHIYIGKFIWDDSNIIFLIFYLLRTIRAFCKSLAIYCGKVKGWKALIEKPILTRDVINRWFGVFYRSYLLLRSTSFYLNIHRHIRMLTCIYLVVSVSSGRGWCCAGAQRAWKHGSQATAGNRSAKAPPGAERGPLSRASRRTGEFYSLLIDTWKLR